MKEIWKSVPGFESYYRVSNYGRVLSLRKNSIMNGYVDKDDYRRIGIKTPEKRTGMGIHRMVALAFIPNPENKPEVNHLDFNRQHNHISNLEWATRKENAVHSRERYGTMIKGDKNYGAKVTNAQAKRIQLLRSQGLLYREIAKLYNLKYYTAVRIANKGYKN